MNNDISNTRKVAWSGRVISVQPRIRLTRSYDERYHSYPGYLLRLEGACGDQSGEFLVAVGNSAHERHAFCIGMELSGVSIPVANPRLEVAGLYRTSRIVILREAENAQSSSPPFHGVPPELETYRFRGHRRLDPRTFQSKCLTCIWGCRMPVTIILDQWDQSRKKYRFETFCYGPKSCPLYRAGATRKVPGRGGLNWEEEDWVDQETTAHRRPDD